MAQIRELIDQSNEAKIREQLEFLLTAAKGKLNEYQNSLNLMFLNPEAQGKIEIVGDRAIAMYKEYRANISTGVDDKITEIVDDFFTGSAEGVRDGFKNIVKTALKTILGSETAGEQEQDFFTVMPVGLALLRIDVKVWRYNFSSTGVISTAKNAFCFLMAKSTVDYTKLTAGEVIFFVQQAVNNDKEKTKELIKEIEELYRELEKKTPVLMPQTLPTVIHERGN